MVNETATQDTHETNEAEEFFNNSGKTQRTFLFAFVTTSNGEKQLVGPASKPELREMLDRLGDVKIEKMIRGREQSFSAKTVISFS